MSGGPDHHTRGREQRLGLRHGVLAEVEDRRGEHGVGPTLDDTVDEADTEIEAGPVRVVVDEKSALYLVGTTLDFVDTLQESGFKMQNPNASSTCGCGESFGA